MFPLLSAKEGLNRPLNLASDALERGESNPNHHAKHRDHLKQVKKFEIVFSYTVSGLK
jgi:hypothetical protein